MTPAKLLVRIRLAKILVKRTPPLGHQFEGKMTAVPAVMECQPGHCTITIQRVSNKSITRKKVIKVLLDIGSNGDLLFHKKGNPQTLPLLK